LGRGARGRRSEERGARSEETKAIGGAMIAVDVKGLSFSYRDGKTVLKDISFSIFEGELFVVAGLSGSGKTTLLKIISGIIPNAVKGNLNGRVTVFDIVPSECSLPEVALRAGMVFQDSDSQIICTTVEDELAFGLENLCQAPETIRLRVEELLFEFGFGGLRYKNPAHLSGGQKKLLAIASILAHAPPVLILDEPMGGLDEQGRLLVRKAILDQKSQGRTVVIVEHDLKLVTFADRWLLLQNGSIAACCAPSVILSDVGMLQGMGLWE